MEQSLSICVTNFVPFLFQCPACVNYFALHAIHNRSTYFPTRPVVLQMLIVHVPSRKHLGTTLTIECLPKVDGHNVTINRVLKHHFVSGAPVPEAIGLAIFRVRLSVPSADVSANVGFGANDPHPAGVAVLGPLTFVDADHTIAFSSAGVEIILIDPHPFNLDGTCTLITPAT